MNINLDQIAIKHGCDKSSLHHDYCRIYDNYLSLVPALKGYRMLEIGYGGYEDPYAGGESARMWKEWAPGLDLTVVDIHQKENIPDGVRFVCGPQANLDTYYELNTRWDAIIDDGSHHNQDIIKTFELLWPVLLSGGLYIIEDTHSSYDPYYPDSSPIPNNPVSISKCGPLPETAMQYFTRLAHQVNKPFFAEQYHEPYEIEFVHFYQDLIIIKKA